jgi:hypothetical protein
MAQQMKGKVKMKHMMLVVSFSVLDIHASYHPPALLFTENTQLKADVDAPVHVSKPVSVPSQANSAAVCATLHRALTVPNLDPCDYQKWRNLGLNVYLRDEKASRKNVLDSGSCLWNSQLHFQKQRAITDFTRTVQVNCARYSQF